MSELADLLELLHTSDSRWRTLRASGRHWWHAPRTLQAFERGIRSRRGGRTVLFGREAETEEYAEREEPWRLWLAPPDRVRAEFLAGDETVTAVIDGDTWWSSSPSYGARTNQGDPRHSHGTGPGEPLVHTAGILPAVRLAIEGTVRVLGRPALGVRATPLPEDPEGHWHGSLHGLGSGADAYDLIVDAEVGVLLRSEAFLDGEPFKVLEMHEVVFDAELPPETFVLEAPGGEPFERVVEDRLVPLQELQDQLPFTVLVPAHPPMPGPEDRFELGERASIMPANPRHEMPTLVQIPYFAGAGRVLTLRESAEPLPVRRHQELRPQGDLMVGEDRTVHPARPNVRLVQNGTHVELEGVGMTLDELVSIARSLVALPSGPPFLAHPAGD